MLGCELCRSAVYRGKLPEVEVAHARRADQQRDRHRRHLEERRGREVCSSGSREHAPRPTSSRFRTGRSAILAVFDHGTHSR